MPSDGSVPGVSLDLIQSPAEWQVIDFISDLHLSATEPKTFAAWQQYLQAASADALFILGDLFEVWVGDDMAQAAHGGFEAQCLAALHRTAQRMPVFFMHGNRDFLVGTDFAQRTGLQLLADPCVLVTGTQRWLLSHGDALCTSDVDYQKFRKEVRSSTWRTHFLAQPLAERMAMARQLRNQSEARKKTGAVYADVNEAMAIAWLDQQTCSHLIHGHTHRPADAPLGSRHQRHVLSDWDCHTQPARAQVFRLARQADATGFQASRLRPTRA